MDDEVRSWLEKAEEDWLSAEWLLLEESLRKVNIWWDVKRVGLSIVQAVAGETLGYFSLASGDAVYLKEGANEGYFYPALIRIPVSWLFIVIGPFRPIKSPDRR